MNGDQDGRTADTIEERLNRHFRAELSRAERDYPSMGVAAPAGRPAVRRAWPRLVALPLGALVVVAVVVLVAPLVLPGTVTAPTLGPAPSRPTDPPSPAASGSSPTIAPSGLVIGSDRVPTQLNGERVFRAADWASFPKSGGFLLGGLVTKPLAHLCPQAMGVTSAQRNLVPSCVATQVDGISVAPKSVDLTADRNRVAVVRVHANDMEAVRCPQAIREACVTALVVDEVVWVGDEIAPSAAPSPSDRHLPPNITASGAPGTGLTPPVPPIAP